jgi:hypothetical protein
MQPVRVSRVSRVRVVVGAALAVAIAAGCSGITHPSPSSPSFKKGVLGNGGFTFKCDDTVACDRYNNADEFPADIAQGSTFELEFLLRADSGSFTYLKSAERGTTVEPVGKWINRGVSGSQGEAFAAVEAGIATISARDSKGWLVDYITVRVKKPDRLVVYDAAYKGSDPTKLVSVAMDTGETRSFRTVAFQGIATPLAGTLAVEWTSSDQDVVAIEGYTRGKVNILARKGSTAPVTLTAKGGGLVATVEVTVTGAVAADAGTNDAGADADADAAQDGGQQ